MTQYHTYSVTFQVKQQMMNFQVKRLRKKKRIINVHLVI